MRQFANAVSLFVNSFVSLVSFSFHHEVSKLIVTFSLTKRNKLINYSRYCTQTSDCEFYRRGRQKNAFVCLWNKCIISTEQEVTIISLQNEVNSKLRELELVLIIAVIVLVLLLCACCVQWREERVIEVSNATHAELELLNTSRDQIV